MNINTERQHVLNKFPQKYRQHILDFSNKITNLDVDILIFTARKAACFFNCLEYLRLWEPGSRIITTDRLIDHDMSWISGKRIAIIDEVIVSGTSLHRLSSTLRLAGASEISIHALFVNEEWFVPAFFGNCVLTSSHIALDGPDAQALGTTIVRAFYGIPRPYSIDFPMSGRNTLGRHQTDSLAFLPGWQWTQIEDQWASNGGIGNVDRLDFFRFEPEESSFARLSLQTGIEVSKLSLAKIRTYGRWENSNGKDTYHFRVVPYLVLEELSITEVEVVFAQVISACTDKSASKLAASCITDKARLRLIQYVFASRLGRAWAKDLKNFGINVSFVEDQREVSFIFPIEIHDAIAELSASTRLSATLPTTQMRTPLETHDDFAAANASPLSTYQYLHLSNKFLSLYLDVEIPARKKAKSLGEAYFLNSTNDRLNQGLTVDELADWAKNTGLDLSRKQLSMFLDIAVDSGIVVPITAKRHRDGDSCTISRAYRHGEETYILQRDLGLFHLMLLNVAEDVNNGARELGLTSALSKTSTLTKILLEKVLVLFVRYAIAKGIFPRVYADSDDRDPAAVRVGIGHDLFGARVATGLHNPTDLPYSNTFIKWLLDTRILRHHLDKGYEINVAWLSPYSKPDRAQRAETIRFSAVVASAIVHLATRANRTNTSPRKVAEELDRTFVTLTTCESEASTLMAIGAELRRFDMELENLGVSANSTIDIRRLVQEASFVQKVMSALNSGFMKMIAYITGEAAKNSSIVSAALAIENKVYGTVWEDIWEAAKRDQSGEKREVLSTHIVGAVEVLLKGLLLTHWARSIALEAGGARAARVAAAVKSMRKKLNELDNLAAWESGHEGVLIAVVNARTYFDNVTKQIGQDWQDISCLVLREFSQLRVLARDQYEWIDAVTADDGRIARLDEYDSVAVINLSVDEHQWSEYFASAYSSLTNAAIQRFRTSTTGPRAYNQDNRSDQDGGSFLLQPVRFGRGNTILSFLSEGKRGIAFLGYLFGECFKLTDTRYVPFSASIVLGLENSRKIHKNAKTGLVSMPTTARALVLAGKERKAGNYASFTTVSDSASKFDYHDALVKEISVSVKRGVQSSVVSDLPVPTAGGSFKVQSFVISKGSDLKGQEGIHMVRRIAWVVIVEDEGASLLYELEQNGLRPKIAQRADGKIVGECILPAQSGDITIRIYISSAQGNTPIGNLLSNVASTESAGLNFIVVSGICCSFGGEGSLTKVAIPTSVLDLQGGIVTNEGGAFRSAGTPLATKPLQLVKWYLMKKGKRKLSNPDSDIDKINILDNAVMVSDNDLLRTDDRREKHRMLARNYSDKAVAYDMETAGIFNWGQENPHFPPAVVFKGLSDFGKTDKSDDDNRTIAARNAMKISLDFIALSIEHVPLVGAS